MADVRGDTPEGEGVEGLPLDIDVSTVNGGKNLPPTGTTAGLVVDTLGLVVVDNAGGEVLAVVVVVVVTVDVGRGVATVIMALEVGMEEDCDIVAAAEDWGSWGGGGGCLPIMNISLAEGLCPACTIGVEVNGLSSGSELGMPLAV